MMRKTPFASMGWNLIPIAFISIYSIVKFNTPEIERNAEIVVQEEVSDLQVSSEVLSVTEEPAEPAKKTFEEKYSAEPYIYLAYTNDVEVKDDLSYVTTKHVKIKIQNSRYKHLGTITVPYVKGREKILSIEAYTTVPGGEKYSYSKLQDRPVYEGYSNYSDFREKIITLPKVTKGAIIEYKYIKETKGKVIKNEFWCVGGLDFSVPVEYDRFSVSFPKGKGISYKEFNLHKQPDIQEDEKNIKYTWEAEEMYVPRKREKYEPFPTPENLENIFLFSSIKSWAEISNWYYDVICEKTVVTEDIKQTAEEIFEGKETVRAKVSTLHEFFNRNFRYISMSFGENTFEPHSTEEVFNNKYGDCKDISLLFKTMLEVGGVKSSMVFFTQEGDSSDPQYDLPIPGMYDHAILFIEDPDEGNFYLDPLVKGYSLEEYPFDYQGSYTFIIDDAGGRFDRFPIFDENRMFEAKRRQYTIKSDGSAECETSHLYDLDYSAKMRKMLRNMSDEEFDEFLIKLDEKHTEVLERSWDGIEKDYGPVEAYVKSREEGLFQVTGDVIILNMRTYDARGHFDDIERKKDFFYPCNSVTLDVKVFVIPEDYEVLHMPEDVDRSMNFFSYKRKYRMTDAREIEVVQCERLKRETVSVGEFNKQKDFFNELRDTSKQRIILRKRKPVIEEFKEFLSRILSRR